MHSVLSDHKTSTLQQIGIPCLLWGRRKLMQSRDILIAPAYVEKGQTSLVVLVVDWNASSHCTILVTLVQDTREKYSTTAVQESMTVFAGTKASSIIAAERNMERLARGPATTWSYVWACKYEIIILKISHHVMFSTRLWVFYSLGPGAGFQTVCCIYIYIYVVDDWLKNLLNQESENAS